jgi:hypothetical protein
MQYGQAKNGPHNFALEKLGIKKQKIKIFLYSFLNKLGY